MFFESGFGNFVFWRYDGGEWEASFFKFFGDGVFVTVFWSFRVVFLGKY